MVWDRQSRKKLAASKSVGVGWMSFLFLFLIEIKDPLTFVIYSPPATRTVSNYQHRLGRIFLERLENGEAV
jgi:hypothetical protein